MLFFIDQFTSTKKVISIFKFYLFFNVYTHTAHGQTLSGPQTIICFFYGDLKEVFINFHFNLILFS